MRVFVYECVSAGGLGSDVPASLLREGRAMLDAVTADFRRLSDVEPITAGHQDFRATAAQCDWTLVIAPEFDSLLHDLSQTVLDVGGRLLGSMPGAIRLAGDKLATAQFWHARGVQHPRTEALPPRDAVTFPPPWVLKPRYGAGSQATFLAWDADELAKSMPLAKSEISGDFLVQEHVPGQAASVALVIGPQQTIPLMPAWQHLSEDGRFRYLGGSLPLPADLADRAVTIALQAVHGISGLAGYVGVDLVLGEDGVDHAIEINPRLTTSYIGLRQLCRGNIADMILRSVQGEAIKPPQWKSGKVGFGA